MKFAEARGIQLLELKALEGKGDCLRGGDLAQGYIQIG